MLAGRAPALARLFLRGGAAGASAGAASAGGKEEEEVARAKLGVIPQRGFAALLRDCGVLSLGPEETDRWVWVKGGVGSGVVRVAAAPSSSSHPSLSLALPELNSLALPLPRLVPPPSAPFRNTPRVVRRRRPQRPRMAPIGRGATGRCGDLLRGRHGAPPRRAAYC